MKTIFKIAKFCLIFLCGIPLYSCQKDEQVIGDLGKTGFAQVNVIDAVVTGGNAKVNVSPKQIYWNSLPNNQEPGGQVLGGFTLGRLFRVPADRKAVMQVVAVNDTTRMWYDHTAQLNPGKVYTLYLSGTPENVKTILHEETSFPKYIVRDVAKRTPSADSIVNIRFINLSPSGPKVDVNIQGKSTLEASNLNYQTFTDFKVYPATKDNESIVFEIRKSSGKELINTYYFNADYFRFKSVVVFMIGVYDPNYQLPLEYTDRYRIEAIAYQ